MASSRARNGLTVRELAALCDASKRTVLYHVQLGALPAHRRGRKRLEVDVLDATVYAREVWNVVVSPSILARIAQVAQIEQSD